MVTQSVAYVNARNLVNVAHYNYQFTRDGGDVGFVQVDGPILPAGAKVVLVGTYTSLDFLAAPTGKLRVHLAGGIAYDSSAPGNSIVTVPLEGHAFVPSPSESPPLFEIMDYPITAGSFDIWLIYVY